MKKKIQRVGNSEGVILPKFVLEEWNLKKGGELKFSYEGGKIIIEPWNKNLE